MKKLLLHFLSLLILISIFQVTYSQELVNDPLPVIDKEPHWVLTDATGIYKGKDGQWDSAKNKISFDLDPQYKDLNNYGKYGPGRDNFIRLELSRISINGKEYNILTKLSNTGYYKYPSIERDWVDNKSITYYIFSDDERAKFKNASGLIKINCIQSGVNRYCNEDCINTLPREINTKKTSTTGLSLYFNIQTLKEKDLVRFLFFSSKENEISKSHNIILVSGGLNEPYKFNKGILLSKDLFNNYFYQTTYKSFQKLFE